MEITVAKSAGFCFGVKRAVETVYNKINGNSKKIYTYGPIIHNKNVTNDLEQRGVSVIEDFDNISDGEVIIRSHGVPPHIYNDLEEKGISYTDCTCPFVKKIHNIVKNCYENEGKSIIIVGNPVHPEVIGINGWCGNSALIIETEEAAEKTVLDKNKKYAMVVQTTFKSEIFNKITDILSEGCNIDIHNTICHATSERQREVTEIAEKVDAMIILGDKSSSNTHKLYEISRKICKKTFLCETICDLELNNFKKNDKIGISAGASTPPAIIKEAINTMSEKSFAEMLENTMVTLHTGDIVKGKVISVNETAVYVDLGYKSDGIIVKSEFSDDPNVVLTDAVNPDDEIEVFVIRVNDGDGNVQLSKKKVDANKSFAEFEDAFNNKTPLKGKVTDVVKGGLMVLINGTRVFVPSSQISNRYVDDLSIYKGEEFNFNIIEFDKNKRRIVAGRKELAQKEYDEKRNKVFSSINPGDKINGTVSRIVDFGAFVDLGGVDGLIHISEMSWGRVKKVTDVLSEGASVEVTVLDVNAEKGKISLSLKDINSDPWKLAADKYSVGSIVEGKVVRMVPFGAFVELEEGVDGLVHISQISHKHVVKPEDVLTIGEEIKAKVTDLDLENKKISLSIKETEPKPETEAVAEEPVEEKSEE